MVLILHGNAGHLSHCLGRLALLHRFGLAALTIDYRGYGQSAGHPTEVGIR